MRLYRRILPALASRPNGKDVRETVALSLLLALIVLPLGLLTGFLTWDPFPVSPGQALLLGMAAFITPALAEELLFRALLIPRSTEVTGSLTQAAWSGLSLAAFVASHPLKAALFSIHRYTFTHPVFLLLAAFLGGACTVSYVRSGSVWPPTLIHWASVAIWLLLFGGHAKLFE